MRCSSCEATISASTRFCPSCGTLFDAGHAGHAAPAGAAAGSATQRLSTTGRGPTGPLRPPAPPTAPIPVAGAATGGTGGAFTDDDDEFRSAPAVETAPTARVPVVEAPGDAGREPHRPAAATSDALRSRLDASAERVRTAAPEVRAAMAGTAIVLLGFLFLPYALGLGTGVATGGRIWWRPIAAIVATVLLALALRNDQAKPATGLADPYPGHVAAGSGTSAGTGATPARDYRMLVVAIVLSTVGATDAGLLGLVSGDNDRLRAGHYVILLGSVIVATATVVAALRRAPR